MVEVGEGSSWKEERGMIAPDQMDRDFRVMTKKSECHVEGDRSQGGF